MAQYIKNANIFGRIGTGIGKGVNEQLPKEVEHQRFRSGLQKLGEKLQQTKISFVFDASLFY